MEIFPLLAAQAKKLAFIGALDSQMPQNENHEFHIRIIVLAFSNWKTKIK